MIVLLFWGERSCSVVSVCVPLSCCHVFGRAPSCVLYVLLCCLLCVDVCHSSFSVRLRSDCFNSLRAAQVTSVMPNSKDRSVFGCQCWEWCCV